jgi:hypothetical protein
MVDLARGRKTDKYSPEGNVLPVLRSLPALAATTYYAGQMIGANGAGYAAGATDGATHMIGRCEERVDNSTGGNGAKNVMVRPGVYYFANGSVHPVVAGDYGLAVYMETNQAVGGAATGGKYPFAGVCLGIRPDAQVAVAVGLAANIAPTYSQARNYARGAAITNHSLTAFTVATNTDGITYAAGDVVLLLGQATVAENGPYVVGTVATTAPLTRPNWWAKGMPVPRGIMIEVSGEGTVYGGMTYKSFVITATKLVDTDSPLLYPRVVKGTKTLSSGAGTVTTLSISSQAKCFAREATADKSCTSTLTAGADLTGQVVFAGTTTSVVKYLITNW